MTYYTGTDYGLIARETVAIDGPEGARGRGGADTALADATASAAELTSDALPVGAPSIDQLVSEARGGLRRLRPEATLAALTDGAVLVDIRPLSSGSSKARSPGPPSSAATCWSGGWTRAARPGSRTARPDARIIVMCSEEVRLLAPAATLRRIGLREATDLEGGFQAWKAAGLPTRPAQSLG